MSTTERAVGVVKSVLLFRETLDRIQAQLADLRSDMVALGASHAGLAERVSRLEGFIQGATRTPFRPDDTPRLPE